MVGPGSLVYIRLAGEKPFAIIPHMVHGVNHCDGIFLRSTSDSDWGMPHKMGACIMETSALRLDETRKNDETLRKNHICPNGHRIPAHKSKTVILRGV